MDISFLCLCWIKNIVFRGLDPFERLPLWFAELCVGRFWLLRSPRSSEGGSEESIALAYVDVDILRSEPQKQSRE